MPFSSTGKQASCIRVTLELLEAVAKKVEQGGIEAGSESR